MDSDYEVEDDDFDLYVDNVEEDISKGASKSKKIGNLDLMAYDIDND